MPNIKLIKFAEEIPHTDLFTGLDLCYSILIEEMEYYPAGSTPRLSLVSAADRILMHMERDTQSNIRRAKLS